MGLSALPWFNLIRFEDSPSNQSLLQIHRYIDFIEMQAISGVDHIYTSDTFSNTVDDFINITSGDEVQSDLVEADINLTDELLEMIDDNNSLQSRISIREHLRKQLIFLKHKHDIFSTYWPFELIENHETNTFDLQYDPEHPYAKLYVLMLFCANIAYIKKSYSSIFSTFFEQNISFCYLSTAFPASAGWVVKNFGANSSTDCYIGDLSERFAQLCADTWIERTTHRLTESGDGKIDLVAFFKFDDQRGNLPIIFGQAACTNNLRTIEDKISEVSYDTIGDILNLHVQHIPFLFSPVDLFSTEQRNRFAIRNRNAAIVDRMRILSIIPSDLFIPDNIMTLINDFIAARHNFLA